MEESNESIPEHIFSKSVYIIITTHGRVSLDSFSFYEPEFNTFQIPEGINVINVMASPPGVVNEICYKRIDSLLHTISGGIEKAKFNESDLIKLPLLTEIIKTITSELKRNDKLLLRESERKYKDLFKTDTKHQDLVHSLDKRFLMKSYTDGQYMLDKRFYYDTTEENLHWLDNRIQIFNLPDQDEDFNFLDKFTVNGKEKGSVYLRNIIDFLHRKGVHNVVIFDLSCSDIDSDEGLTPRGVRSLRRYKPYGGGKKHTYRKKIYRKHTYRKHIYRKKRRTTRRYKK